MNEPSLVTKLRQNETTCKMNDEKHKLMSFIQQVQINKTKKKHGNAQRLASPAD
jgi:hypothetical protein